MVLSRLIAILLVIGTTMCMKPFDPHDQDDIVLPKNFGTLEVDFAIPFFPDIQKGIRRADLAVCNSMYEMSKEQFFYRTNVSDAKQIYQINLPEGTYYYRAAITCTCSADSCVNGGFPFGYGGMKYALDEVVIVKGQKTYSQPSFQ